jgi:hypothetical protein
MNTFSITASGSKGEKGVKTFDVKVDIEMSDEAMADTNAVSMTALGMLLGYHREMVSFADGHEWARPLVLSTTRTVETVVRKVVEKSAAKKEQPEPSTKSWDWVLTKLCNGEKFASKCGTYGVCYKNNIEHITGYHVSGGTKTVGVFSGVELLEWTKINRVVWALAPSADTTVSKEPNTPQATATFEKVFAQMGNTPNTPQAAATFEKVFAQMDSTPEHVHEPENLEQMLWYIRNYGGRVNGWMESGEVSVVWVVDDEVFITSNCDGHIIKATAEVIPTVMWLQPKAGNFTIAKEA